MESLVLVYIPRTLIWITLGSTEVFESNLKDLKVMVPNLHKFLDNNGLKDPQVHDENYQCNCHTKIQVLFPSSKVLSKSALKKKGLQRVGSRANLTASSWLASLE